MLDRILNFIVTFLTKTTTTTTITPEAGTGVCYVMQFGKVVILSAQINTTDAFTHGDILVDGLPRSKVPNPLVPMLDSNTGWMLASPQAYLNNTDTTGRIRIYGNQEAKNRSLRLSFAYIAS